MKNILYLIIFLSLAGTAFGKEYFKHTDQNGVEAWLDDKSKIPSNFPKYYKYVDKNGISFWVNDISKIPKEYSKQALQKNDGTSSDAAIDSAARRQYSTKIRIKENQITLPVTFINRGRKVKARMILDTGASVTTIYPRVASQLKLSKNSKKKRVRSISANGAGTDSMLTKVDYIEVDGKILANPEVIIMPIQANIGADGLLGNSYLRFFNFTIDYEKQLLMWN